MSNIARHIARGVLGGFASKHKLRLLAFHRPLGIGLKGESYDRKARLVDTNPERKFPC